MNFAAVAGSLALAGMPKPCVSTTGVRRHLALAERRQLHEADDVLAELLLRVGQRRRVVERHRRLAGVVQLDALVQRERGRVVVPELVVVQLLQLDPVLVVLRLAPVELADEEIERIGRGVEVLRQRVDQPPLAEEAVLDSAAERDVALRLELVAGVQERIPGLRRRVGVEAGLVEVVLVVLHAEGERVEARAVRLARVLRELRAAAVLDRGGRDEAVERLQVVQPDVLHVVDPVEQELHVGDVAGRRGLRELRDHLRGVHQRRRDARAGLGLELLDRVVHPRLDADGLLLAPPPHLDVAGARPSRGGRRAEQRREARRGRTAGGHLHQPAACHRLCEQLIHSFPPLEWWPAQARRHRRSTCRASAGDYLLCRRSWQIG